MRVYVLMFIVAISHIACTRAEGTYVANHMSGHDTLTIKHDGTYRHMFHTYDNGKVFVDVGNWKMKHGSIMFYSWVDRIGLSGRKDAVKVLFITELESGVLSCSTKVMLDYDRDLYFLKE